MHLGSVTAPVQVFTPARAIAQKAMSQPKPADTLLTKKGLPRKRAPGGGRHVAGRDQNLSRVSNETHRQLKAIAQARTCSLTEAVEFAVQEAFNRLPQV